MRGRGAQFRDPTGRYLHLQTSGRSEYGKPESMDYVRRLRDDLVPAAGFPEGCTCTRAVGRQVGSTSST